MKPFARGAVDRLRTGKVSVMPELPDLIGFDQYLKSQALHKKIVHTSIHDERILDDVSAAALQHRLKNHALDATRRWGKNLFVKITDSGWLVLHFGMTGGLGYYENGDEPHHTRMRLDFDNGGHLAYQSQRMLGHVGWTDDPQQYAQHKELGPDALEAADDRALFRERLKGRRGSMKSVLMNQSVLAGIGNVYSDEILFQQCLHPESHVNQLGDTALDELRRTTRRVLEVCGRHVGDIDTLPEGYLLPHRDRGENCPRCGTTLKWSKVHSRSACYCPKCQKKN